ncbi:M16 family metallopeptidase [Maricaulaceae bacterium MS644]
MFSHRCFRVLTIALIAGLASACGPGGDDRAASGAERRAAFDRADFPHEASDIPADEGVRYGVLDNGMRFAIMENGTPTGTASMRLVLNVGSLAEAEDQRGLAHFIEHMAFNGTTNVPEDEMVPLLERYGLAFGADSNAFTGREVVGYTLDLPSTDAQVIDVGLFLLRETVSEMLFDAGAIDRERGIIAGEERFRNTPVSRFFNAYYEFLYPDTLIPDRDPIGLSDVIQNAPREAFVAYYEKFYTPERALLVVTGDFDADAIESRIRDGFAIQVPGLDVERVEGFSTWVQPEPAAPDPDLGLVSAFSEPAFGFHYDPDVFTLITVDVIEPGPGDVDTRETRLEDLKRNLANAIVQRRIQNQINRGDSPLVQANLSYSNDFGLVDRAGVLGVSSPERWREGVAVLENELRRALEYGFTQGELDEQLANVRTSLRNAADQADTRQTGDLADAIWRAWINGDVFADPRYALDWFSRIEEELTLAAVDEAFTGMWTAGPPQVFLGHNQELQDGPAAVREAWRAASAEPVDAPVDEVAQAFAYTDFGDQGAVVSRDTLDEFGVTRVVFDNGVRLNVKPTNFEDNVIRLRVDFGAGDLTPQPAAAAGSILGAVFGGGGLEAHDRNALQRLLAGRSVGYGVGVGDDTFFFSNATTPTDFELQMQVLAAFMTAPGWREDGLNQFRAIAEEVRRGQNAQAVQVAINQVSRMLRSGDPRWGFPTQEELNAFTMEDARAMLEPALTRAPVEITVVGDITVDTAVNTVASTFAALPPRDESWPDYAGNAEVAFPEPTPDPVVVRFNGQPDQGMANIYYPAGDGIDPLRRRALTLLSEIYNLKANDRFREREGATYSAIVSGQFSETFEDFGFIWVGLDVDVSDVERMYAVADEIASAMAAGEISEDELQRARQPLLEQLEEQRERNAFWVNALSRSQQEPERLAQIRTAEDDYRSITVEALTALAGEVLRPEAAYRVSILPRPVQE